LNYGSTNGDDDSNKNDFGEEGANKFGPVHYHNDSREMQNASNGAEKLAGSTKQASIKGSSKINSSSIGQKPFGIGTGKKTQMT